MALEPPPPQTPGVREVVSRALAAPLGDGALMPPIDLGELYRLAVFWRAHLVDEGLDPESAIIGALALAGEAGIDLGDAQAAIDRGLEG